MPISRATPFFHVLPGYIYSALLLTFLVKLRVIRDKFQPVGRLFETNFVMLYQFWVKCIGTSFADIVGYAADRIASLVVSSKTISILRLRPLLSLRWTQSFARIDFCLCVAFLRKCTDDKVDIAYST